MQGGGKGDQLSAREKVSQGQEMGASRPLLHICAYVERQLMTEKGCHLFSPLQRSASNAPLFTPWLVDAHMSEARPLWVQDDAAGGRRARLLSLVDPALTTIG